MSRAAWLPAAPDASMLSRIPGHISIDFVHGWLARFPAGAPRLLRLWPRAAGALGRRWDRRLVSRTPTALRELVRGKRVCVTGPSKSVLHNEPGWVDAYDLVVRLNSTWPVRPERQARLGRRCDVWYHACSAAGDLSEAIGHGDFPRIRFMRLMPHVDDDTLADSLVRLGRNERIVSSSDYVNKYLLLRDACERHAIPRADFHHTSPMPYLRRSGERHAHALNTGFFAICELLDCEPAELYVTGITFHCEDDLADYPGAPGGVRFREGPDTHHNTDGLFEIFKRIRSRDARVRIDPTLEEIIRRDGVKRVAHYRGAAGRSGAPDFDGT